MFSCSDTTRCLWLDSSFAPSPPSSPPVFGGADPLPRAQHRAGHHPQPHDPPPHQPLCRHRLSPQQPQPLELGPGSPAGIAEVTSSASNLTSRAFGSCTCQLGRSLFGLAGHLFNRLPPFQARNPRPRKHLGQPPLVDLSVLSLRRLACYNVTLQSYYRSLHHSQARPATRGKRRGKW